MRKVLVLIVALALLLVGCGQTTQVQKPDRLSEMMKWMNEYVSLDVDQFRGITAGAMGLPYKPRYKNYSQTLKELLSQPYPCDRSKTYRDVLKDTSTVTGSVSLEYSYIPVCKEDYQRAEQLAGKKSDRYYVVGVMKVAVGVPITTTQALMSLITSTVYISAEEPGK